MTEPATQQQWHVKQEVSGQQRTLFSGLEKDAREFVRNNFPRPHVRQGEDGAHADVQVHGADGSVHEYHGDGAVGADESGFVTTKQGTATVDLTSEGEGEQQ